MYLFLVVGWRIEEESRVATKSHTKIQSLKTTVIHDVIMWLSSPSGPAGGGTVELL